MRFSKSIWPPRLDEASIYIETMLPKMSSDAFWRIISAMMFILWWTLQILTTRWTKDGDKRVLVRSLITNQIIERARQDHLFDTFRSQTSTLNTVLLSQVRDAWRTYVRDRVSKGVPEDVKPTVGNEDEAWTRISELYKNAEWKQESLKREGKFDMYFTSAVRLTC